jgi:MFS family permease
LCTIMMMELVPPEGYAQFVANISLSVALGLLLGPILGGTISSHSSWRWIFILKFVPKAN